MIPVEAVARQGWHAALTLGYAASDGRTALVERRHQGPLRVQKPLYPEGPHPCHTIVVHPPGGIVGGDALGLTLDLGAGAHALLTTPGAAKWYRSAGATARQTLHFTLAPAAVLEWLPQETLLFDAARAELSSSIHLHADALYLGWEILCFGRPASGERFTRGRVRTANEIWRDGKRLWNEHALLAGGDPLLDAAPGCARHPVCATLLVAGRDVDRNLLAQLRAVTIDAVTAGISALPGVLVARCLAPFAQHARNYFAALWQVLRPALLGCPALAPRIWST